MTPYTLSPSPSSSLSRSPAWQALADHAKEMAPRHLRDLFAAPDNRFDQFSLRHGALLADFSKQRISAATLNLLHRYGVEADVAGWAQKMRQGAAINHTEGRAVRHTALRAPAGSPDGAPEAAAVLARMGDCCERIHGGAWRGFSGERITDVVNLGIGGSDLGPRMAVKALAAWQQPDLTVHFAANVDGAELAAILAPLNPRSTLFIVASKTFSTLETLTNAATARQWLLAVAPPAAVGRHFAAASANFEAAAAFGIPAENVFPFWDWVGGRFSLWSSVGLAIALAVGFHHFEQLLAGAADMDGHFFTAPAATNLPLTLALLSLWNTSFLGAQTQAILPYSQSLALLPAYLQQLEMESNGKQTGRDGQPVGVPTCPIVWGEAGLNGQHSFYQLIHQGGRCIPCDFIAFREADFPLAGHHRHVLGNCLAQSAALAFGQTAEEARAAGVCESLLPYKTFPGNQPSTTLLVERLTPFTLGQLLALYEHKVFCLGALWGLNAFDQWGVELGKTLAARLIPFVDDAGAAVPETLDASTRGLLAAIHDAGRVQ